MATFFKLNIDPSNWQCPRKASHILFSNYDYNPKKIIDFHFQCSQKTKLKKITYGTYKMYSNLCKCRFEVDWISDVYEEKKNKNLQAYVYSLARMNECEINTSLQANIILWPSYDWTCNKSGITLKQSQSHWNVTERD